MVEFESDEMRRGEEDDFGRSCDEIGSTSLVCRPVLLLGILWPGR